jgi:hypothetical protein
MSLPIATLTGANTIAQLIYNVNQIKTFAANTVGIVANSTFQSTLANTNSYIATKTSTTTFNSALANTNTYINTKVNTTTFNSALANTNSYIATKVNTANPLFSGTVYVGGPAPVVLVGDSSVSTGNIRVELGSGRTGDGIAYIDLLGDTTYTDYGTRILRNATANGTTDLRHRGTGGLQIIAQEAAPIQFYTTDTERARITSSGNVGIGTSSPDGRLHSSVVDGSTVFKLERTGSGAASYDVDFSGAIYNQRLSGGSAFTWNEGGVEHMRLDSSGNFGLGTTTIDNFGGGHKTLEVSGSSNAHGGVFKTATSDSAGAGSAGTEMLMYTTSSGGTIAVTSADPLLFHTSNTERARITSGGTFVVGTTGGLNSELIHARASSGTISTLYNSGATGDVLRLYHENTAVTAFSIWGGGAQRGFISSPVSSDGLIFGTSSTERMRLAANGNVLIGTSTSDKQLTLYSATDASQGISLRNNSAGTSAASYISMGNDSDALDGQIFLTGSMNTSLAGTRSLNFLSNVGAFGFYRNRLSPVATMVMGTSGTVGIGATGNYTLTVGPQGGSGHSIVQLVNATTGTTAADGAYISVLGSQSDMRVWQQENANILVGTNGAERMRITGGGLVGIGAAPTTSARLEVFANNTSTHSFFRGDNHGVRFGFSATESLIDSVTAAISDFAPLQINAKTSLTLRLNSATVVDLTTSGMTVTGTAVATQGMPIASQSANTKTLALTDNGSYVRCSNSTTMTITIPANATVAFPTGAEMVFFQVGAGNVQFANAAGVTVNSKESLVNLTGQYSAATLKKIATNTWDLIGDLA